MAGHKLVSEAVLDSNPITYAYVYGRRKLWHMDFGEGHRYQKRRLNRGQESSVRFDYDCRCRKDWQQNQQQGLNTQKAKTKRTRRGRKKCKKGTTAH